MRQNKNTWFYIGRSGLDWTDDFQRFCGSGLDRIQFYQIRTGLGLKNFTVRSSLLPRYLIQSGLYLYKSSGCTFDCSDQRSLDIHIRSDRVSFEIQSDLGLVMNCRILFDRDLEPVHGQHWCKHTLSAQRRMIKTDTQRFKTALGIESRDYKYFLNTIVR